jgi:hypothetical protein
VALLASKTAEIRKLFVEVGIERSRATKLISSGCDLRHDLNVTAEDFLQQAEDDLEMGANAAFLNAITNAKRAIHAQIDEVLNALGYRTRNLDFHKRLALFADLGFVAPRILKRINDARNVLEHEYVAPTLAQVEEAIDLAVLFIGATKGHCGRWDHECAIGNYEDKVDEFDFSTEIAVSFDDDSKCFRLEGHMDVLPFEKWCALKDQRKSRVIGKLALHPDEPLFAAFVRLILAGDSERKNREALDLICSGLQI